ncbi:FMN-binding protein [Clostridium beijerinckii]|uniref:FMN-binding protein n=1 Tax=Clostridium beijerinckii TaxID=1520 RepID=UPI0003D34703|nr:FMN-binding protein [Clostridium beijerinckii]ALB45279.1 FMN-binding protein [Clostridium beijerinckii NRRL B-598]
MKINVKKIGIRKIIQLIAALPLTIMLINNFSYSATILVIIAAICGSFYCGYLCPFGLLQELSSTVGKKLKIKKKTIPDKLDKILRLLRYVLFVLVTFFSIGFISSLLKFDARSNLFLILTGKPAKIIMFVSILGFAALSLFYNKIFCKYFCIQGAKYGLASYLRLFTIKRDANSCINCKRCDKACDMNIKISTCNKTVNSLNCINCFECIKNCPKKNTLTYGMVEGKTRNIKIACSLGVLLVFFGINQYRQQTNIKSEEAVVKEETTAPKKGEADNSVYYVGNSAGYKGNIKVKVGVSDGKITKVSVLEQQDDWDYYSKAKKGVINEILEKQSTDVDVVSGATYSSKGIIGAVKDSLENKVVAE